MKIAIDASQIVYGTGVSNYTKELIESLLKIDQKNEYLIFGASLRSYPKLLRFQRTLEDYKNVSFKFYLFPPSILNLLWNRMHIFPIDKYIKEADLFHSSDWIQPPVKSQKTKKVTTIHDMTVYLFASSHHPKTVKTQKKRLNRVKNEVDMILADSYSTKEDIEKFLEIPSEKITVIPLAAANDFKPQDDGKINQTLEKYKIKKPYILSVSTQEPRKNIQKLLDVFGQIQKGNPEIHLVLAGKHGWGNEYRDSTNFTVTGYIPEEDLINLYAGCRVFVYPSLYEGFGLPILEAMSCGAPVITSNNSSMAEIAKDAAILVDPRNENQIKRAIEMVLGLDLENYQKMVRASLDRARQYSWQKTARQTLKVYEDLVNEKDQDQRQDQQEESSPSIPSIE